eukprot:9419250-Lingulodinium_polyedra.AAC.1
MLAEHTVDDLNLDGDHDWGHAGRGPGVEEDGVVEVGAVGQALAARMGHPPPSRKQCWGRKGCPCSSQPL